MNHGTTGLNFYQLWLSVSCTARPDHYQLLGLKRFESDEQKIRAAFEMQRDRLRRTSPGQYGAQWRKLADEVIAAKRCLLSPAARLAYDEHLRYRATLEPIQRKADDELTLAKETLPGGAATPATAHKLRATTAEALGPTTPLPPMDSDDDMVLGNVPELPPMADPSSSASPNVLFNPVPVYSVPGAGLPMGMPTTPPPNAPHAAGPVVVPVDRTPAARGSAIAILEKSRRQTQRTLIVSTVCLAAAVGLGLFLISELNPDKSAETAIKAVARDGNGGTETSKSDGSTVQSETAPSETAPAVTEATVEPQGTVSEPTSTPIADSSPDPVEVPIPPTETMPPEAAVDPPAETTAPVEATSPERPMPPDSQQAEKFRNALAAARKSLAERNLAAAKERLSEAERLAVSDEQLRQLELSQRLDHYVNEFWDAVREGMVKLNAGDELDREGKVFAVVVEVEGDQLTVRVGGRNFTFTVPGDVKPVVAVTIARRTLKDQPEENVLLGAFYATDADGDFGEAEKLWQTAGDDLQPLLEWLKSESAESNGTN